VSLPDLLAPGLRVVFVGINPSRYAASEGHYFARRSNRFWPAFSRSRLSLPAREGLGTERLLPVHDRLLPRFGFGFTDVVKRASDSAAEVTIEEFERGVPLLLAKLEAVRPRVVCFNGLTAARAVLGHDAALGFDERPLAGARVFVAPSPSGRNPPSNRLAEWYDRLAEDLEAGRPPPSRSRADQRKE
jgi:TDG/mug DNA glycosylase family protein